jgi:hypothetical protein
MSCVQNWSFVDLQRPSSTSALRAEPVRMLDKLTIRPAVTLRPVEAGRKPAAKRSSFKSSTGARAARIWS